MTSTTTKTTASPPSDWGVAQWSRFQRCDPSPISSWLLSLAVSLLFLVAQLATAKALPGVWEVQGNQPIMRSVAAAACNDNYLYLYGGRDGDAHILSDLWQFNPKDSAVPFQQIFPGGEEPLRQDAGLAALGDMVYVFGGVDAEGEVITSTVRMDPSDTIWEVVPDNEYRPTSRSQHATVGGLDDGYYVAFGLAAHKFLNDLWFYNVTSNVWTALSDTNENAAEIGVSHPEGRLSSCCDMDDTRSGIVCFGGSGLAGHFNDTWRFDFTTKKWTELRPPDGVAPPARFGAVCGYKRGRFMVTVGGNIDGKLFNDSWILDVSTKKWSNGPTAPFKKTDTQGCLVGDTLYILSGIDDDEVPSNDMWRLEWDDFVWRQVMPNVVLPPARSSAAYARIGDQLYMMWGLGNNVVTFDEIWVYNFVTRVWALLDNDRWVGSSKNRPRYGKVGSATIERGTVIWTFGGYYTNAAKEFTFTNDLVQFDVSNDGNELEEILAYGDRPGMRSHAAAVRVEEDMIIYGGYNQDEIEYDDFWVFNARIADWMGPLTVLNPAAGPKLSKAGAALHLLPNGTLVLIGGSRNGEEKWGITLNRSATPWTVTYFPLVNRIPTGHLIRWYRRSEAGFIGVGNVIAVCGGANTDEYMSYPDEVECFTYNALTGENEPFARPEMGEVTTAGPGKPMMNMAVAHWANRFMWFHGSVMTDGIVRDDVCSTQQQEYVVNTSFLCDTGAQDGECLHCSRGHFKQGSACVMAPPGYFVEAPGSGSQPCDPGEFTLENASISAQSCLPCEEDSYNSRPGQASCLPCPQGMHCPIRAKVPVPKDADTEALGGVSESDRQPLSLSKGEVPTPVYWSFLSIGLFFFLLLIILVLVHFMFRRKRLSHYITDSERDRIRLIVKRYDPFNAGLDENGVLLVVMDVGFDCNEEFAMSMVTKYDTTGTRRLFEMDVFQVICELLSKDLLPQMPGSLASHKGPLSAVVEKVGGFQLKSIDLFTTQHRLTKPGESLLITRSTSGGILSLFYAVGTAMLVIQLILSFSYSNVFEIRSTIPRVVVEEELLSNFVVVIETNGDDNWQNCVSNFSTRTVVGSCSSAYVNASGWTIKGKSQLQCRFDDPRSCQAVWTCERCGIAKEKATLELLLYDEDWFSDETHVQIQVSSGVEATSSRSEIVMYSDDDYVFKGLPATTAFAEMTSTVFTSPVSVWDQAQYQQTGYHVRTLPQSSTIGNQVDYTEFPHTFGVPVTVLFSEIDTTLLVTRVASATVIQLVAAVLGAVSGMTGIVVFILNLTDEAQLKFIERNLAKQDALRRTYSGFNKAQSVAKKYLSNMIRADISYSAAQAAYEMAQRVVRDVMSGRLDPPSSDEDDDDKARRSARQQAQARIGLTGGRVRRRSSIVLATTDEGRPGGPSSSSDVEMKGTEGESPEKLPQDSAGTVTSVSTTHSPSS